MKNISYCVALLIVAGSTGACSDSATRLSPTSPTAIAPSALGSDSTGGVRNTTSGAGTASGSDSTVGTDPGASAGGGSTAGGDPGATAGGGSTAGGGGGSGSGDPGATAGATVTAVGVVAWVSGACPEMEIRLDTAPYMIVTSAATAFVSNGASTGGACAQVAPGAAVSVTGVVAAQTTPSHSPTLRAQRVKVK